MFRFEAKWVNCENELTIQRDLLRKRKTLSSSHRKEKLKKLKKRKKKKNKRKKIRQKEVNFW